VDILTLIQEDHQKVTALFKKLKNASAEREPVFAQLKEELELHSHAEEQVFYPAIQEVHEAADMIEEALQDHELVAELLNDLATTPQEGEAWTEKLALLEENVQDHVEEEESTIFEVARQLFTADQMEALSSRWQAAKQEQTVGKSSH
jgi:iron-sulfur cluster repair protein YtfE (RIC family)